MVRHGLYMFPAVAHFNYHSHYLFPYLLVSGFSHPTQRFLLTFSRLFVHVSKMIHYINYFMIAFRARSPSTGASISYTKPWSQPFPEQIFYRTALREGFSGIQFKDPIKTEPDRVLCFTSHSPMRRARN